MPIAGLAVRAIGGGRGGHAAERAGRGRLQPACHSGASGLGWAVLCLAAAGLLGFAPVLFMVGSTMRYLVDLTPCLMIVAALGAWQVGRAVAGWRVVSKAWWAMVAFLTIFSIGVGLLLGVSGYYDHFFHFNEDLFTAMSGRPYPPAIGDLR